MAYGMEVSASAMNAVEPGSVRAVGTVVAPPKNLRLRWRGLRETSPSAMTCKNRIRPMYQSIQSLRKQELRHQPHWQRLLLLLLLVLHERHLLLCLKGSSLFNVFYFFPTPKCGVSLAQAEF